MAAVTLPVAPIAFAGAWVLAGACVLAGGGCGSSAIEPGGTGGESTGGGSGGASDGMGGDGAGGTPCTPPTSGVMVDGVSRFQYGINYAWASFAGDFGNTTRGVSATKAQRLTAMMDMKAHGVDAVRWWVFPNFTGGGVTFDSAGSPTGFGGSTLADITAALDDAAQADIHIQFTLFSFDNFKTATMPPHNLAPIISSPTMLSALINNVVIPFANQVNSDPNKDRVSSWDVINEPEWAIAATPTDGSDAAFTPQTTVTTVTYPVMKAFVQAVADALHGASNKPVTVGGAAIKWAKAWAGIGDFYTFHMYDWVNMSYPYTKSLASYGVTDKPVVLGEFPIQGLTGVSYATLVSTIYQLGYAGAMAWAYNDNKNFPWSPNNLNVQAFATAHPCMFAP
jgi:hypothetical protein